MEDDAPLIGWDETIKQVRAQFLKAKHEWLESEVLRDQLDVQFEEHFWGEFAVDQIINAELRR